MATNGISSNGMLPQTGAALEAAIRAKSGSGAEFAKVEAQSKNLQAYSNRFDKPVNQHTQLGMGAMAQRHVGVGSGDASARARGAGGVIKNMLSSLSSGLSAVMNAAKTLAKHLQNYRFSPSAKTSSPATERAAANSKQQLAAAAAGQGRETARTAAPRESSIASKNHRPGGLNQKLAEIEKRAKDLSEAAALLKASQGRS